MAINDENLKFADGKWGYYAGCSCSAANFREVDLPQNSKPVMFKQFNTLIGPVSGQYYKVTSHQVSLDIDARDADVWLADGTATEYNAALGKRGRLTRYEPPKQT